MFGSGICKPKEYSGHVLMQGATAFGSVYLVKGQMNGKDSKQFIVQNYQKYGDMPDKPRKFPFTVSGKTSSFAFVLMQPFFNAVKWYVNIY